MDPDNVAIRKEFRQNSECDSVVGIVKRGDQNEPIGDVEVGVACRQALIAKDDRPRQRQFDNRKLLAVGGAGSLQAREVFNQRLVVGIFCIWLNGGDNGCRPDETSDVVDMAVRVVADNSPPQPDHLLDAEIVVECTFKLLAAHAGVALLDFAQQTLFGGEQDSLSIGVYRTTFENQSALFAGEIDNRLPFEEG